MAALARTSAGQAVTDWLGHIGGRTAENHAAAEPLWCRFLCVAGDSAGLVMRGRLGRRASQPPGGGPADISALVVHVMLNAAVNGATFDIDRASQQLIGM
jgi:hypothetical protein